MKYLYVQQMIIPIFPVSSDPAVLFIYRTLVYSEEEQTFPSASTLHLCLITSLKIHKNR